MHGPGSTTVDVANETAKLNETIRFSMQFGAGYASTIRSEMGMRAVLIADDALDGDEPYWHTVQDYKLLRSMQRRVIAEIHQRYDVGNL